MITCLTQITAETVTEVGDPKELICEAVEKSNVQLLVLGSHSHGALQRWVIWYYEIFAILHKLFLCVEIILLDGS